MTVLWAVLDAQGVIAEDVAPQPVHLHSDELRSSSEAAALCVWPGSDVTLPGSEGGSLPSPVTGNWSCSQGWKCATLVAASRMDPVCPSWDGSEQELAVLC